MWGLPDALLPGPRIILDTPTRGGVIILCVVMSFGGGKMGENEAPEDLQEAVERSYQAQWGGRRFCLVTAIVLFVLAVASGVVLTVAHRWFEPEQ